MKYLLLIIIFASCSNGANTKQAYEDSAEFYSNKMAEIADSPVPIDEMEAARQKNLYKIYTIKRQYYIDLMDGK